MLPEGRMCFCRRCHPSARSASLGGQLPPAGKCSSHLAWQRGVDVELLGGQNLSPRVASCWVKLWISTIIKSLEQP